MNSVMATLHCPSVYEYKNTGFQKKLSSCVKGKPEPNSEILITGIPQEATVYDLALFFEKIGQLYDVKLISSGSQNKGFGYVRYFTQVLAEKAKQMLSTKPFKGVLLSLFTTANNCRIFLRGIPTDKTQKDVWKALIDKYDIENIVDVKVRQDMNDPTKNKGFAILKFATHEEAVYFKIHFQSKLNLFNQKLVVDWALPEKKIDTSKADVQIESEVKVLFLRNLPVSIGSEEFARLVYTLIGKHAVEKVFKFKDYAFVHLFTRAQAETLLEVFKEKYDDTLVEVQFAKPGDKYTTRSYREKMLEQRRNYGLPKKSNSVNSDLTDFELKFSKNSVKDLWKHDKNYQEVASLNKASSEGFPSTPFPTSTKSNVWAYPNEKSVFGWFPFSLNYEESVNDWYSHSPSNFSNMNTTPDFEDDYCFTVDFEDMVKKLVEDD